MACKDVAFDQEVFVLRIRHRYPEHFTIKSDNLGKVKSLVNNDIKTMIRIEKNDDYWIVIDSLDMCYLSVFKEFHEI